MQEKIYYQVHIIQATKDSTSYLEQEVVFSRLMQCIDTLKIKSQI